MTDFDWLILERIYEPRPLPRRKYHLPIFYHLCLIAAGCGVLIALLTGN